MADIKYRYLWYIEDEKIVRHDPDTPRLEYFDAWKCEWVHDWELSEIYTGSVRFRCLEEEDAKQIRDIILRAKNPLEARIRVRDYLARK